MGFKAKGITIKRMTEERKTIALHEKPSCPANGSARAPPDDRLQRGIQYSETVKLDLDAAAYWITRFRG